MILVLRISSMLALVLACLLLAVAVVRWWDDRPPVASLQETVALADRLAQIAGRSTTASSEVPPLVVQARVFADRLTPRKNPEASATAVDSPAAKDAPQATALPSATLKLHATSCYPDHPERSMALVSAAGGPTQGQRWVKEGTQFGSFHIHEIRRGGIIYREGDLLREVAIEPGEERPSIVRSTQIDSPQALASIGSAIRPVRGVAGPNDVEITGN